MKVELTDLKIVQSVRVEMHSASSAEACQRLEEWLQQRPDLWTAGECIQHELFTAYVESFAMQLAARTEGGPKDTSATE